MVVFKALTLLENLAPLATLSNPSTAAPASEMFTQSPLSSVAQKPKNQTSTIAKTKPDREKQLTKQMPAAGYVRDKSANGTATSSRGNQAYEQFHVAIKTKTRRHT